MPCWLARVAAGALLVSDFDKLRFHPDGSPSMAAQDEDREQVEIRHHASVSSAREQLDVEKLFASADGSIRHIRTARKLEGVHELAISAIREQCHHRAGVIGHAESLSLCLVSIEQRAPVDVARASRAVSRDRKMDGTTCP